MGNVWLAGLIVLCFGLTSAQIQYISLGGKLELRPPPGSATDITGVQWRHGDNIAAEWQKGDTAVDTYNNFKTRAALNTTTGYLTVSDMTREEAGEYSLVLNNNHLPQKYKVEVIKAVPVPNVWVQPTKDRYELSCEGDVKGAGPVTYFWNLGKDRSWVEMAMKVEVKKNETTHMESFSCKIKNPVSEKESKPEANPFYPKSEGSSGLEALAIIPIVALIVLIGVGYWKKDPIKKRLCPGKDEGESRKENGSSDPSTERPLTAPENEAPPSNFVEDSV